MRNVLRSTKEVFHYWANQVQESGKASAVSFEGPTLYSYAAVIARIYDEGVLHSTNQWSITTSGHQSAARYASRHLTSCYAPVVTAYTMVSLHDQNKAAWRTQLGRCLDELAAHPRRKKSVSAKINAILNLRNAYRDFFKLDWEDADLGALTEEVKAANAEALASAEQFRLAQIEKVRQRAIEQQEDLFRWRNGEDVRTSFIVTACRVVGDEIETTHGARFPVDHAKALWPTLCQLFNEHKSYRRNGHTFHLGVYALDSFNEDMNGTLKAGCHTVAWEELESIAAVIGLPPSSNYLEQRLEAA